MPNVTTVCFHTRDAVRQEAGGASFTFRMPSTKMREDAQKVVLASCEFPMTQWTIEEDPVAWNRMWFNEGVVVDEEHAFLTLQWKLGDMRREAEPVEVRVPLCKTAVKLVSSAATELTFESTTPHGLEGFRGTLRLVGAPRGDAVRKTWKVLTSHRFTVPCGADGADRATALLLPPHASPHALCEVLQRATAAALPDPAPFRLSFRYDASHDRVLVTGSATQKGTIARFLPTPLLRLCGVSMAPVRFHGERVDVVWPCEETSFWDHTTIPPGFYGPCHRPMCVGQPSRIQTELEASMNRFYFPLQKEEDEHLLLFTDPSGRILSCQIYNGRYTPHVLCRHLEAGMTLAAAEHDPHVFFSVYLKDDDRFVFTCERRVASGAVTPAAFGILFHHPMCVDAARFGFAPQPLTGAHTYVAPARTRAACVRGRYPRNMVRVGETVGQKRFDVHATAMPAMVAVATGDGSPRFQTYVNRMPFAHGLQVDDPVRLTPHEAVTLRRDGRDLDARETVAKLPDECTCFVARVVDALTVELALPSLSGLADAGTCVQLSSDVQPFNLNFCKAKSIPAAALGFDSKVVQWGVDGSVSDGDGCMAPPFLAPHTHCLDHPDYVLMTFSESSNASFEHISDGESKQIFCKLSLYPLFREERMLPRDTTLMRNNLNEFTIAFWNPDMRTPYNFHGAQFSFSLSFVSE